MVVVSASRQPVRDRERTASGGQQVTDQTVLRGGRDGESYGLRITRGTIRAEEIGEDFHTYQGWCDYVDYGGGWTVVSRKRGCNQTGSRPQAGNTWHSGIEVEESVMELEGEKVIPGQGDSIQTPEDRSWYRRSVERRRKACRRNKRRGQNRSAARQQDRWKRDHTRYSTTESMLTQSAIAANLAMVQSTATLTPVHVNTTITITGNGHGKSQDNRDRKRHRKSQRLRRQERDRREKQARLKQESTTIREQIKKYVKRCTQRLRGQHMQQLGLPVGCGDV